MTSPEHARAPAVLPWEADLVAFARSRLERRTNRLRYRHLYPTGPNYGLVVASMQALDRRLATGEIAPSPRALKRWIARDLDRRLDADAACRQAHTAHRIPPPIRRPIATRLPDAVARAIEQVDGDVRHDVAAWVTQARVRPPPKSDESIIDPRHTQARFERGLSQFRQALFWELAKKPSAMAGLHHELLAALDPPYPPRLAHPVAVLVLLKAPLYLWMALVVLFNVVYLAAFVFFNDAVLGRFVSTQVSSILQGELEIREIHWRPRLVVDFLLGRPTPLVAKGVSIYEPYKDYVDERGRKAVVADEVHLSMTLHEIVPWTRIGVPTFFDVPWILHFSDVRIEHPVSFWIRRYRTETLDGRPVDVLGLRDAFRLHGLEPDPNARGLSVVLDDARIDRALVEIDDAEIGGWQAAIDARDADVWIDFEAPPPGHTDAGPIPFRFHLAARPARGLVDIAGRRFPVGGGSTLALDAGHGDVDDGDVAVRLTAPIARSPMDVTGLLRHVFRYDEGTITTVELGMRTNDAGPFVRHLLGELDIAPHRVAADEGPANVTIVGPLAAPDFFVSLEAGRVDLFDEPAWVAESMAADVLIHRRGVAPELRTPAVDADAERWQFLFGRLEADVLDGHVALRSVPATIVMPDEDHEPWVIDADLAVTEADPAGLVPTQPALARSLAGRASGGLDVRLEILPPSPEDEADGGGETTFSARLRFDRMRLRRRLGPEHDGLPRTMTIHGEVHRDHDGSIGTSGLRLSTAGGRAIVSGLLLPGAERIEGGDLDVEVGDGHAFSRAFGWRPFFQRLHATLGFAGPTAALSGPPGRLSAAGIGLPGSPGGAIPEARIWIDRGTLKLRAPRGRLLGGTGRVDVDLQIARNGRFLETPRVRASIDLDGIELDTLLGDTVDGAADLRLEVGTDDDAPVPIDALEARAALFARRVSVRGHTFSDAEAQLRLTPDRLAIERLVLPFHRRVSPFHAPKVTVPIGRVVARGTVGLAQPHPLDVTVEAEGVPVGLLTSLVLDESPLFAQIADGTRLRIHGSARRPSADGTIRMVGVHVAGIALGAGEMRIRSDDVPAAGPLAEHREVRVEGDLSTRDRSLQSRIDGVVALGSDGSVDAQANVYFARVGLDHVLRSLHGRTTELPPVAAGIEGLDAEVLACGAESPMLSDCASAQAHRGGYTANLSAERIFVVPRNAMRGRDRAPCTHPDALCSTTRVHADIGDSRIRLAAPVEMRTPAGRALTIAGVFDISSPAAETATCAPPLSRTHRRSDAAGRAIVRGVLDLGSVVPLFAPDVTVDGSVAVDLAIEGPLFAPDLSGSIRKTSGGSPIEVRLGEHDPFEIDRIEVRPIGSELAISGRMRQDRDAVELLADAGRTTYVTYRGPCAGRFAAYARGDLPASLVAGYLPRSVRLRGRARLDDLEVQGTFGDPTKVRSARMVLASGGRHRIDIDADLGIETMRWRSGMVEGRYCGVAPCPRGLEPGRTDFLIGGPTAVEAQRAPPSAVAVDVGPRGRARLWGRLALDLATGELAETDLHATLRDVTVRTHDGQGRAELIATISSSDLELLGAAPPRLRGTLTVDDGRWVKNALENVGLLSFLGDGSEAPDAPPPAAIRDLMLDLHVATAAPLRVDNNIAEGVEARFEVHTTGTYDRPEFAGRMEIDPGGLVRLPFVGGTFEIQEGRVILERDIEDAVVDVVAERQEPVYVEGQPRRFTVRLTGPLRAIRWECDTGTIGRNSAAEDTTDTCVDYLLLGAGDVPNTVAVQGPASSGLLYARKGMNVVGNVAEVNVTRQIDRAVPRIAPYMPDVRLRLGQLGPEIDIRTPRTWFDFDYGYATVGFGYTRGYPGFLLRSNQDLSFRLRLLDVFNLEARRSRRSYLNQRVVFDPLEQGVLEATVDLEIPSMR
ncbi:MAG: hypothetical protein D6705_03305 [Deltaproteobacteria bacterium]|nr:MAG: hypothetical protein D6705_03305 [Deltaproteobacteria bacterium]